MIGGSPVNSQPVFDTIVDQGAAIVRCRLRDIARREGDGFRVAAGYYDLRRISRLRGTGRSLPSTGNSITGRTVLAQRVCACRRRDSWTRTFALSESARRSGMRSISAVSHCCAMAIVVGALDLGRSHVRPFTGPADRTCSDLRRSGGDRDRERATAASYATHSDLRSRWNTRPRPATC